MELEITEPQTEHELAEAFRLRYERLRRPLGLPAGSEQDDLLEDLSTHVIAKLGDRVVGAGVYIVVPSRAGLIVRVRQLAVDKEFATLGVGKAITLHIEAQALAVGAIEMHARVRERAVSAFMRYNPSYELTDERVMVFDVEHVGMVKRFT